MGSRRSGRAYGDEETGVVLAQVLPFRFDIVADVQDDGDIGADARRLLLADVGFAHFDYGEADNGLGHASPSAEDGHQALLRLPRFHAEDGIFNVLPDLVGRLQAEEIEVAQQVVVQRQKLQVEFRQRQAAFAGEVLGRHDVFVPYDVLRRIQRHLVQRFQLRRPLLVPRNLKKTSKIKTKSNVIIELVCD